MAKRSPILGYNHNVRYRGLVWHVQTEDSGLANPHLFTHLFHEGVIVSTRKLVYDNGADEGAIKSLMQAQHKAVMKDLKRGHFDDKIDLYLGGTPGLLPRGGVEEASAGGDVPREDRLTTESLPLTKVPAGGAPPAAAKAMLDAPTTAGSELDPPTLRAETPIAAPRTSTKAGTEGAPARTGTVPTPKIALDLDPPTELTVPTKPPAPTDAVAQAKMTAKQLASVDSSAEISLELDEDDDGPTGDLEADIETGDRDLPNAPPRRRTHDTEINVPEAATEAIEDGATRKNIAPDMGGIELGSAGLGPAGPGGRDRPIDSIPPLPPPPGAEPAGTGSQRRITGDRPAVNASTLPPPRQITRPPTARPVSSAMAPPNVVSRPLAPASSSDVPRLRTAPETSEPVEIYSSAPPSAELPQSERPGQYAQHRSKSPLSTDAIPVPGRSGPVPAIPRAPLPNPQTQPTTSTLPRTAAPSNSPSTGVPQSVRAEQSGGNVSGSGRARTPTPARIPQGPSRPNAAASGGVVMTRPAVIVGAPAKPAGGIPARPRKAREEESGRGFGQGLISEKSLDEVILAYLSEDADEK